MPRPAVFGIAVVLALTGGCDLFSARTPEAPESGAGTFVQPDAPEIVVDNLQAAIAEMNTANYRRSLSDDLVVEPTAAAQARNPSLWANWGKTQEVSAFSTLAEAARLNTGHVLRLEDPSTDVGDTRFTLDATYVLIVLHRRPDVPDTLQGRLIWEIVQGEDGLWSLAHWTDRALGTSPSWSDLKAEFGN